MGGASHILCVVMPMLRKKSTWDGTFARFKMGGKDSYYVSKMVSILSIGLLFYWSAQYVCHCTFMSAMAYSSPSIVTSSNMRDGSRVIQDDFREAYYWLRQNTHKRATVASWWDYGYQITSLANRTVIVDNNMEQHAHRHRGAHALVQREGRVRHHQPAR